MMGYSLKRIWKNNFILFFIAFLGVAQVALGAELNWQRKGKFLLRSYQDTVEDDAYEDTHAVEARLRFENAFSLTKQGIYFEINLEARHDTFVRDGRTRQDNTHLFLKEALAQLRKEKYNFSVGRQTVTWGKLDNITILDIVNPQDFTKFILFNKQERKLPELMFKYDYLGEGFKLESIFMPMFKPFAVTYFGSDWALFGRLKEATEGSTQGPDVQDTIRGINVQDNPKLYDHKIKNGQVALRLNSKAGRMDCSLYYMNIYSRLPILEENTAKGNIVKNFLYLPTNANLDGLMNSGAAGDDLILISQHRRMHVIGIDGETVLGEYGLRGEAGLFLGTPYLRRDFSYAKKNNLNAGIGIDHTTANNFYYNLQFIENIIFNYEDLFAQEEYDHRLTCKVSRDYLRGDLLFGLDSSFSLSYHDWMLNPKITYKFKNGFDLSLAGFIFEGDPTSIFGRFSTKDLIYLEATRKF